MLALFVVYLTSSSRSHLQYSDPFFVQADISIQAGKSINYFLPIVYTYNYTRKVYEYNINVRGFLDSTLIYRTKR